MEEKKLLLSVRNLKKYFPVYAGSTRKGHKILKALDGVSIDIHEGETLGLVGESGCGKSTLGKCILLLEKPTQGDIVFDSEHIEKYNNRKMRPLRRDMQIIFQDPYAALNPRLTVFESVKEPLNVQNLCSEEEKAQKVIDILRYVGIPVDDIYKYPHEMSGGQRQRVVIARAMITGPRFVVCDEPVSALDVSIRSQVLNLMKKMQKETGVAYLFISHDLSVVKYICENVAVMYLGQIVEKASSKQLFNEPLHPYTQTLMASIPIPDIHARHNWDEIKGEIPSPIDPPSGCRFHNRCRLACEKCAKEAPELREIRQGHWAACHFAEQFIGCEKTK